MMLEFTNRAGQRILIFREHISSIWEGPFGTNIATMLNTYTVMESYDEVRLALRGMRENNELSL
jgi:hypothetical protein